MNVEVEYNEFDDPIEIYRKKLGWFKRVIVEYRRNLIDQKDSFQVRLPGFVLPDSMKSAVFTREELVKSADLIDRLRARGVQSITIKPQWFLHNVYGPNAIRVPPKAAGTLIDALRTAAKYDPGHVDAARGAYR